MIKNILFPVDFSPTCAQAAPFIRAMSDTFAAPVTLLHVIKPFDFSAFELVGRTAPEIEQEQSQIAHQRLAAFLAQELPAAQNQRQLAYGDPAEQIIATAQAGHFDLLAIPTYSEGSFRRTLLGSTAAKVLNDADCAVLTPPHAATVPARAFGQRRIACAIRLDEEGVRVLRYSGQLAQNAGAQLAIIHALPAHATGLTVLFDQEEEQQTRAAHERLDQLQREAGTHAEVRIARGPLRQAILDQVGELGSGLLVIGRSPVSGAVGRMRDLTYALIRDAHCPVISV